MGDIAAVAPVPRRRLGLDMQAALRAGAGLLLPDVRERLQHHLAPGVAYAQGALHPAAPAAQPDLYYTLFAQWLCEALDVPVATARLRQALAHQPAQMLDPIHRACHACLTARVRTTRRQRLRLLCELPRTLLIGLRTPYPLFIAALTLEQCGGRPWWFALAWWAPWNWGATPQAAAILAVQALAGSALNRGQRAQAWILDQRLPTGGFRSSPAAPCADLLATATARFALALAGWRESDDETRRLAAFIDACRTPTGLWAGHPGLATGDVEYTFYALLALGSAFTDPSRTCRMELPRPSPPS
jgi:hypothetical protein